MPPISRWNLSERTTHVVPSSTSGKRHAVRDLPRLFTRVRWFSGPFRLFRSAPVERSHIYVSAECRIVRIRCPRIDTMSRTRTHQCTLSDVGAAGGGLLTLLIGPMYFFARTT